MKKIIISLRNINPKSGLGKIALSHAQHFAQIGQKVTFVTTRCFPFEHSHITCHKIPKLGWLGDSISRRWFAYFTKNLTNRPGIFHIGHGDTFQQDLLFIHNLNETAYRFIEGREMNPLVPLAKLRREIICKGNYKYLIANSYLMKHYLIKDYGLQENKIKVLYPGYDPNQFFPDTSGHLRQTARAKLNIQPSTILLGFITSGNFHKRGLDLLLEALLHIERKNCLHDNLKLLIVGRDKNKTKWLEKVVGSKLANCLIFHEPQISVENFYHAVDLMIHPARFEEFGMVVAEAMACGSPVLTSNNVGASELIKEKDLLIDKPTPKKLSDAIMHLLHNPSLLKHLRTTVPQNVYCCRWKNHLNNLDQLINETIAIEK